MWKFILSLCLLALGQLSWSANNTSSGIKNLEVGIVANSVKQQKTKQDGKERKIVYLIVACGFLALISLILLILLILQKNQIKKTLFLSATKNQKNKKVTNNFKKQKIGKNMTSTQDSNLSINSSLAYDGDSNKPDQKNIAPEGQPQSSQSINQSAGLYLQDKKNLSN